MPDAIAILHAWGCGVEGPTWPMDHELEHQGLQLIVVFRDFSRDEAVNGLWTPQLGICVEEDNEMHMGEASLLKFNGVNTSDCSS